MYKALVNLNNAIRLDSTISEEYLLKGRIYWQSDNYSEADRAFDKVLLLDSANTDAYYCRARALYCLGKYKAVIRDMQKVQVKNLPESAQGLYEYYWFIGASYCRHQEYDSAIKYLSLSLKYNKNKKDPTTNYYLGDSYLNISQYKEALKYISQYNKLTPDDAEGYSDMGLIYLGLGNYDEATEAFNKALKFDSTDFYVFLRYGKLLLARNIYKGALNAFDKSIKLMNDSSTIDKIGNPYYYRAQTYFKLNNNPSGCEDLNSAKRLGYDLQKIEELAKQYCKN